MLENGIKGFLQWRRPLCVLQFKPRACGSADPAHLGISFLVDGTVIGCGWVSNSGGSECQSSGHGSSGAITGSVPVPKRTTAGVGAPPTKL